LKPENTCRTITQYIISSFLEPVQTMWEMLFIEYVARGMIVQI
jgi:hypothetical protein